jgi:hypothetical protein
MPPPPPPLRALQPPFAHPPSRRRLPPAGITLSPNQVKRGTELAAERGLPNVQFQVCLLEGGGGGGGGSGCQAKVKQWQRRAATTAGAASAEELAAGLPHVLVPAEHAARAPTRSFTPCQQQPLALNLLLAPPPTTSRAGPSHRRPHDPVTPRRANLAPTHPQRMHPPRPPHTSPHSRPQWWTIP